MMDEGDRSSDPLPDDIFSGPQIASFLSSQTSLEATVNVGWGGRGLLRRRRRPPSTSQGTSKKYEGSSDLGELRYHMDPVLSDVPLHLYVPCHGRWDLALQAYVRDFLLSLSDPSPPWPSVAGWWVTTVLYADQTLANVTSRVTLAGVAAGHLPRRLQPTPDPPAPRAPPAMA